MLSTVGMTPTELPYTIQPPPCWVVACHMQLLQMGTHLASSSSSSSLSITLSLVVVAVVQLLLGTTILPAKMLRGLLLCKKHGYQQENVRARATRPERTWRHRKRSVMHRSTCMRVCARLRGHGTFYAHIMLHYVTRGCFATVAGSGRYKQVDTARRLALEAAIADFNFGKVPDVRRITSKDVPWFHQEPAARSSNRLE